MAVIPNEAIFNKSASVAKTNAAWLLLNALGMRFSLVVAVWIWYSK